MSAEKKVPEIRFKGFSGEWIFKVISELISEEILYPPKDGNHGNIHPKGTDYVEYGIPFIMANNIREGVIQFNSCNHIRLSQAEKLQKGFAKAGDVLLTHKGTVGEVAVVPDIEFPYLMLTPQVTYYRIDNANLLDNNFLATSFITSNFQVPLKSEAGGGTRAYIGITAQQSLGISIPPQKEEQTAIGKTFQKLDSLINQHQQKHDQLSNIKKAMLEKMFPKQGETTPEIRFKGFSGEWKASKLADLALFNPKEELPASFKYVDLESVKGTSLMGYRQESKEHAPSRAQRLAEKGDVFFQTVRPYQKNNYLFNKDENNYVFSTGYAQLRPYYNGEFLLNLVQRDKFVKDVLDNCTGTSYPAINASVLAALEVSYPKLKEEQTAIGNYFQKLDTLISQHQNQITKLNNIKQACLSKMFV